MKQIKKMVAISVLLAATKCTKFVFGRASASDPAAGAHDAPRDRLVGWGGDTPAHSPPLGTYAASILMPSALVSAVFC